LNNQILNSLSDNALMLKVKSGETDKLGLLYERYKKKLLGFFFKMNHDLEASEDLVQNVFVRILKYKHNFTGSGKFSTWMYHIARNMYYDQYKKNKKSEKNVDVESISYKLVDENNFDSEMHRNEQLVQLQRALQALHPEKRELLILSRYQELKYHEISEVTGISEGAVRVKIHRTLKELKGLFLKLENKTHGY
jgi:RNA polymerase sigma-70 factor (ECF subfamily)